MPAVDLSSVRVRGIVADDRARSSYFVFAGRRLFRVNAGSAKAELIATTPTIRKMAPKLGASRPGCNELEIKLYSDGNWVCVTERFGTHAALVKVDTGDARPLRRENHDADVSSYSIGFLRQSDTGRTLLIAQTQWNRLDVFDAATGECLTNREVKIRKLGQKAGETYPEYEYTNYVDYFHSLLLVSPDSRHFLDNGWVWHPVGTVLAFSTEAFLHRWEPTAAWCSGSGDSWDRPAAFLDNRRFALALDDLRPDERLNEEDLGGYKYRQLGLFTLPDFPPPDGKTTWIEPVSYVDCDVFPRNSHGEVTGELHYDSARNCLIAITETNGAFALSLEGEVLAHMPDVFIPAPPSPDGALGNLCARALGWTYSAKHRVFYRYADGGVEERTLPE
ncbi:MAG: hypothetical protein LBC97_05400 [Bifidobacteriaceae bacterium]|jgi:hypothetical protein|nr:hypothetical protein [Bifidobacteriaceae bacterium]